VTTRVYRSLFLFCVLVLVLYGLGNVQEFLDGNQLMLLAGRSLALDALLFAANAALLVGVEMILAWLQVPAA
jgi:hypothetical protein